MNGMESHGSEFWQPFVRFGIHNTFFTIERTTVINTWIVLILLFIILFPVRWLLKKRYSVARQLILGLVANFMGLTTQSLGRFIYGHFVFITSLFFFILTCNIISIIPWLNEEPTSNINTTLALGIISFMYTQINGIRTHGLLGYLKEYLEPAFVMAPIHVIGKLASIVSISCRLFGNIFGGSIIMQLYFGSIANSWITQLIGLAIGLNFLILFFFGLFEGFLQAFVFTMLSLTYLSLAVQHEETEKEAAGAHS